MGIFNFIKGVGKAVGIGNEADEIQANIESKLSGHVDSLGVRFDDGTVTLGGYVADQAAREKAVLLAGNIKGVEKVDDRLTIRPPEPVFYTIESGDSLSKIAKEQYGDAMKWKALFEANREVIEDPDKIYPGQRIRIPQDV
ncbi:MAG: peptidoglycan-binding protein LysM [Rhodothermales bacterium]|nr:peptidoglycan-binding protein LysM [Rhodothermales bacterium]